VKPVCRSSHWAVKNTKNTVKKTGKNDTASIPVLNTFKITTFPHLDHRSNMTEYSFYKGIRYRNAKTSQIICSNQCCHFWCFNIRSDVLREISDVWCIGNKSDVDWAVVCFPNFLHFSDDNELDSWFLSFFHQFLTLTVCLVIVPN